MADHIGDEGHTSTSERPAASLQARPSVQVLQSADPGLEGRSFALGELTTFGRDPQATVVVADYGVSRLHARISRTPDGFEVEDLGSKNGTWVNGLRVRKAQLKPGDFVQIGSSTVLRLFLGSDAEQELRRHALVFESLPDPVLATDLAGKVLDVNPAWERLFRTSRHDVTGKDVFEALGRPPGAVTAEVVRAVLAEGRWFAELDVQGAGARLCCEVTATPVRRSVSETVGVMLSVRDVGERKRLQAQLAVSERLAALGTLSAGIAHEINNPLAYILANVEFLRGELAPLAPLLPAQARQALAEVMAENEEGLHRIAAVVRDLRAFSRQDAEVSAPVPVNAGQVMQLAVKMASHTLRHRVRLDVELEDVPKVLAQGHQLAQVFLNLLINAGQAIPESVAGVIRVRLSGGPPGWVCLEVRDNGVGIAAEVLPRIFEPFFTTKAEGVGTGLGLSLVHGIVTSLGGQITVQSQPGEGTTFRVSLRTAQATPEQALRRPAPPAGRARLLIVDDEALVLSSVARSLSAHEVTGAQSAKGALKLLAERQFDVVLCDLMMPEMSGIELHAALHELNPALASRTIFMTGGAFTERAGAFVKEVKLPVLSKPLDLELLRRTIAELMPGA